MKKLNKTEVDALSRKIIYEIEDSYYLKDDEVKLAIEKELNIFMRSHTYDTLKKYIKDKHILSGILIKEAEKILNAIYPDKECKVLQTFPGDPKLINIGDLKIVVRANSYRNRLSLSKITDDIILSQIEAKDLEDLKVSIMHKYTDK